MNASDLNEAIVDAEDGSRLDPTQFTVFDNGGLTTDRYTVLPYLAKPGLTDASRGVALALSGDPESPDGVSQWVEMSARAVKNHTLDLGHRVSWGELPKAVRSHVRFRLSQEGGSYDLAAPEIASRQRMSC